MEKKLTKKQKEQVQRLELFIAEFNELRNKYGCDLKAEVLISDAQTKPVFNLKPVLTR